MAVRTLHEGLRITCQSRCQSQVGDHVLRHVKSHIGDSYEIICFAIPSLEWTPRDSDSLSLGALTPARSVGTSSIAAFAFTGQARLPNFLVPPLSLQPDMPLVEAAARMAVMTNGTMAKQALCKPTCHQDESASRRLCLPPSPGRSWGRFSKRGLTVCPGHCPRPPCGGFCAC